MIILAIVLVLIGISSVRRINKETAEIDVPGILVIALGLILTVVYLLCEI